MGCLHYISLNSNAVLHVSPTVKLSQSIQSGKSLAILRPFSIITRNGIAQNQCLVQLKAIKFSSKNQIHTNSNVFQDASLDVALPQIIALAG
jgi:hypothetical protein